MQLKTIIVCDEKDLEDTIPDTPQEFLDFWQQKIDLIPEQYLSATGIELATEWDSGAITLSISYDRPETEDEKIAREYRDSNIAKEVRRRDLATLAELQAKYC